MKAPPHAVTALVLEFPSGLKTAEQIAEAVPGVTAGRLLELAEAGYAPHYRIDGGPPQFKLAETKQWLAENLVARNPGRSLASCLRVVVGAPPLVDVPPPCLQQLAGLGQMPLRHCAPGVYFLCKGEEVVYVGQSVAPMARLATHVAEDRKDFDRAYLLLVPESNLNDVEGAFIRHLTPVHNGGVHRGKPRLVAPLPSRPVLDIVAEFTCPPEIA